MRHIHYTRTDQRGEGGGRRLRGLFGGVMGEKRSVEDTWYDVLRIFGWQEE